jgi:hypothetical protein
MWNASPKRLLNSEKAAIVRNDNIFIVCAFSGVCRNVDDICTLLGYYADLSGNSLPTFRDNQSARPSRVKNYKEMGPIGCPETPVQNYHSWLRNIPEERI